MIIVSSISNFEWYQNYFKRQLKKQSIVFYDFLGSLSTDTKSAIDFLINIEKVRILNVAFNYSCFIQMFECIQKYLKINSNNWIDLSKSPKKRNSTLNVIILHTINHIMVIDVILPTREHLIGIHGPECSLHYVCLMGNTIIQNF